MGKTKKITNVVSVVAGPYSFQVWFQSQAQKLNFRLLLIPLPRLLTFLDMPPFLYIQKDCEK